MTPNGSSGTDADTSTTTTTAPSSNAPTTAAIELSENFYIHNSRRKNNFKIQVKLNSEGIYLRRETDHNDHINEQLLRIEDIVGSSCGPCQKKRARGGLISCSRKLDPSEEQQQEEEKLKTNGISSSKDSSAYLYIYAYIKQENPSLRRFRTVRILRFRSYEHYEENLKCALRWYNAIKTIKSAHLPQGMMDARKELLILLNPKSGSSKGKELFHKQVAPVLKEAEMLYDLQVTTRPNFARDMIRQRRDLLVRYSGIVVASGDGLLHEVLNGLMERPDWRSITQKLPVGIIPCGSGNGLAKSIAYIFNEPYEPKPILNATLTCVSKKTAPMDIVRVEVAKGGKSIEMFSFLSVGWGLIADVDIESEKLRSIGAPRFTIWTIRRLINLRTYKGKLSYLPWRKEHAELAQANSINDQQQQQQQQEQKQPSANAQQNSAAANSQNDIPNVPVDEDEDEFADAISLDRSSYQIDSWHSATSRRTAYYSLAGQSIRSQRSVTSSILSKLESINADYEARRPTSTIPPLGLPVPTETWHCEEGEFVMVHTACTTHLSSDCLFSPDSRLNDGIIYLVIIRAGVGRGQLTQFLRLLSSSTHWQIEPNEFIEIVPVTAFRIEPQGTEGIMTVDGERVAYGPIQGEIFPGIIKLMVPNAKSTE